MEAKVVVFNVDEDVTEAGVLIGIVLLASAFTALSEDPELEPGCGDVE